VVGGCVPRQPIVCPSATAAVSRAATGPALLDAVILIDPLDRSSENNSLDEFVLCRDHGCLFELPGKDGMYRRGVRYGWARLGRCLSALALTW